MYEIILKLADLVSGLTQAILITFLLALLLEKLRPANKNVPFLHGETKLEIANAFIIGLLVWPLAKLCIDLFFLTAVQNNIAHDFTSKTVAEWPFWLQFITAAVLIDLGLYWYHRMMHAWLWPFHAVHHESKNVNWSTSWRFHPLDIIISFFTLLIPFFIGYPPEVILYSSFAASFMSNFTHFNVRLGWPGPFKYLLTSPHYHHWHHARAKEAVDKNFCIVFPFLDLIFGTYYCPDEEPEEYGVFQPEIPGGMIGKFIRPFREQTAQIKNRLQNRRK
ncbi:MAG: sterol desaturase family protein [Micavibrio sp.]|nr:MAG: sterol desaturase family protein [Micavibrio sp.]